MVLAKNEERIGYASATHQNLKYPSLSKANIRLLMIANMKSEKKWMSLKEEKESKK